MKLDNPNPRDIQYAAEFTATVTGAFDKVTVNVFLCGKGLQVASTRRRSSRDLRSFLRLKLEKELKNCRVKVGEHRELMRINRKIVGPSVFNLADHEIGIARTTDLLVIFPCSPGSFAELGMFCSEPIIAGKMAIFLSAKFRKSKGFIIEGPVAAAEIRNSRVFVVNYADRAAIWAKVRDLVLALRVVKGKEKLLAR
jgi:hypothetical protein